RARGRFAPIVRLRGQVQTPGSSVSPQGDTGPQATQRGTSVPAARRAAFLCAFLLLLLLLSGAAQSQNRAITVTAPNHDYHQTPVLIVIDAPRDFAGVALFHDRARVPVQAGLIGPQAEVTWIVDDLKRGDTIEYELAFERVSRPVPASGVILDRSGE